MSNPPQDPNYGYGQPQYGQPGQPQQPQQPQYDPYGQQQYGQQQQQYGGGYAPAPAVGGYGVDAYGQPLSDKSKMVAGLLQILLGSFGAGRFYTGHTGMAVGQIAATWLTCGIGGIWPLIDGIMILVNGGTDAQGRRLRDS